MAFIPLPVFSHEYPSYLDLVTRSHKDMQSLSENRYLIEHSTLNQIEKNMLLKKLTQKT